MIENGLIYDLPASEYHSISDRISNSYLSRLAISPAHAKVKQEETEAMRIGTAFHSYILDGLTTFAKTCAVLPEINRRTNAGKDEYAAFCDENKGKTIISKEDFEAIVEMDKSVKAHPLARNMIDKGKNEVSIFWTDPFSGLDCKARADKVIPEQRTIVDLKKTKDASRHGFLSSVLKYGYFRQNAMYLDGINIATKGGFDLFAFIAVEENEPYRCEVYYLSEAFIEYGRNDFHMLSVLERRCRENNSWPNYTSDTATELELPKYLINAA